MASPPSGSPLVPLRLPTGAQWLLRHVLSDRIEAVRRAPPAGPPPPEEIVRALEKVEEGSHLFTPEELRHVRRELTAYLKRGDLSPVERRAAGEAVERVDAALGDRRRRIPG